MTKAAKPHPLPFFEFVMLMATISSLSALSIDAMLPALPIIGDALGSNSSNDNQLIITLFFFGMAIAQLFYGPISDCVGRKPMAYLGFGLFFAGCLLCITASDFTTILVGRFLQGVGLGGPRIVSIAIIRDQYSGREMARVLSFIMSIFILVPIIAPALGQAILLIAEWEMIFIMLLSVGLFSSTWFFLRQPETLKSQDRHSFSLKRISADLLCICKDPKVMTYTFAAGLVFGAFIAYLSSIQQILHQLYGLGQEFSLYFGALAVSIGFASLTNGKLVIKFGMLHISYIALIGLSILSVIFSLIAWFYSGLPPLWMLMTYFTLALFFVGLLFGNLNSLAMEPLGHIAGVGASVVGFITTMLSAILAVIIGGAYNETVLPLIIGFAICSFIALFIIWLYRLVSIKTE